MTRDAIATLLGKLSHFLRFRDDDEDTVRAWLEQLEVEATADDLPDLLAMLDDEDTTGALWGVLYIAENLGEAYLEALVDALPKLWSRAPNWAITATLRIVNTFGEPDDCVPEFVALAKRDPKAMLTLEALLDTVEVEDHLVDDQQDALDAMRAALKANRGRA